MKVKVELDSPDLKLLINQLKIMCSYYDKKFPDNIGHNALRGHKLLERFEKAKETLSLENSKTIDFDI